MGSLGGRVGDVAVSGCGLEQDDWRQRSQRGICPGPDVSIEVRWCVILDGLLSSQVGRPGGGGS